MNATTETLTQRFEPNVQLAKGQVIGIAALAAVVLAGLDYFKLQLEHSVLRTACVAGFGFVALSVLFWFKTGRYGCQTVVLDDSGLTLETRDNRSVLPWVELSEITLVGDSVLKLQSRNAREPLQLHNTGFTLEQWNAIKRAFQSRGYATVAMYAGSADAEHWEDFSPMMADCATEDNDAIKRVTSSIPAEEWTDLEEGLKAVPLPLKMGLYPFKRAGALRTFPKEIAYE